MSFIQKSAISYEEAVVLRFAMQKIVPHFENVAKEANGDRKVKADANIAAAKDMLSDLEKALSPIEP